MEYDGLMEYKSPNQLEELRRRAGVTKQYQARALPITEETVSEAQRTGMAKKIEQAMDVTRNIRVNRINMNPNDWKGLGLDPRISSAIISLLNSAKNEEEAKSMLRTYMGRKYPKLNPQVFQVFDLMSEITFNG